MSIQKLIQESIAGNPLEMKEALAEELRSRVAEALAAKMEEVQELDEISKKTLGAYVKKASSDMANNAYALGARDPLKKPGSWEKAFKRKEGITKATDRLTKEEVELEEAFKRGDILHVPGAGGTKHPAVHLGTKAVYLDDEGAVEHVPHESLKNAEIAKRVPTKHKMLAKQYLDNMKEETEELDEVSDKKLDAYRQKAFADQPAGDDGSDKYRKRKFGRDLAFAKQTGRAKVLATKESVEELDELKKSTLGSYINKAASDVGHIQRDITRSGTKSPDYKNLSRMRRNRKAGIATAVKKLTREEAELDESEGRQIVDKLKSTGNHEEAGKMAFKHGLGRNYGPHFGMRSNKYSAETAYHKGYDKAELANRKKT